MLAYGKKVKTAPFPTIGETSITFTRGGEPLGYVPISVSMVGGGLSTTYGDRTFQMHMPDGAGPGARVVVWLNDDPQQAHIFYLDLGTTFTGTVDIPVVTPVVVQDPNQAVTPGYESPVRGNTYSSNVLTSRILEVEIEVFCDGVATPGRTMGVSYNQLLTTASAVVPGTGKHYKNQLEASSLSIYPMLVVYDDATKLGASFPHGITTDCRMVVDLATGQPPQVTLYNKPPRDPAPVKNVGFSPYYRYDRSEPLRRVTIQITREGEKTPQMKQVKVFRDELTSVPLYTYYITNGYEYTELFTAAAIDGERFVQAVDETAPKVGSLRWPVIAQDVTMRFDLSSGEGGGGGPTGDDATINAVVRVNNMPANREVVMIQREIDGKWTLVGNGSVGDTGVGTIALKALPDASVFAVAVDNWGIPFQPGLEVAAGTVVRPSTYVGWVYEITESGVLPSVEPLWWPADEVNPSRPVGTARAVATRYFRPLAHGPVPIELVE